MLKIIAQFVDGELNDLRQSRLMRKFYAEFPHVDYQAFDQHGWAGVNHGLYHMVEGGIRGRVRTLLYQQDAYASEFKERHPECAERINTRLQQERTDLEAHADELVEQVLAEREQLDARRSARLPWYAAMTPDVSGSFHDVTRRD